jgi:DNA-binding transcriptional ArsR family regulator
MISYNNQAQLFKVLIHPARLAILEILRNGEQCVCHMETFLGYRQAYISQQLAVLREAGLIQDRREGWNIFYRVSEPRIYAVLDAAREIGQATLPPGAPQFGQVDCPCPKCRSSFA